MWIVCQADDSNVMSSIISCQSSASRLPVVIGTLRVKKFCGCKVTRHCTAVDKSSNRDKSSDKFVYSSKESYSQTSLYQHSIYRQDSLQ